MYKRGYILLIVMLLANIFTPATSQVKKNAFTIDNDNMVLNIDLKLSKAQIDSLLRIADIKNTNADNLLHGKYDALTKGGWTVKKNDKNVLMLLKPLAELNTNSQTQSFLITQNLAVNNDQKQVGYPGVISYGINNFTRQTTHELPSGLTRFFLPGNLTAKKVLLSGSFNNWNTSRGVMFKTDSGWIADVKLKPGECLYKFIVNGHWMHDPNNRLKEDDGYDDANSIYFRYNYTFKLSGFKSAQRITIAGSFNNWNGNELIMMLKGNVWLKPMYLAEGMNTYHFLIDGKAITDPANPTTVIDETGKKVSVLNVGNPVVFKLKGYPNAKSVTVAGDFNNWKPGVIHLKKSGDFWILNAILPTGNYGYKFIIDGNWISDPANLHRFVDDNSLLTVKPNHTFVLHGYANANNVRLAGSFSNWESGAYTMQKTATDWRISLNLKPGKYLYKFIVDGNWIIDPGNKLWEQNAEHTGNSVLWIEP